MHQGGASLYEFYFAMCVSCLSVMLSCMFLTALWSPVGKGLTSWLSCICFLVFLSLSNMVSGSGLILDCIDSRCLPSFLLCSTDALDYEYFLLCLMLRDIFFKFHPNILRKISDQKKCNLDHTKTFSLFLV